MPNWGEVFNWTEEQRKQGNQSPEMLEMNRYAQTADEPALAFAAAPYEGLKYVEQNTPVKPLSGIADVYESLYGTNPLSEAIRPDETTSPASWRNVIASYGGALDRWR